jgi:hypothetical protein
MALMRWLPIALSAVVLGLGAASCGDDEDSAPTLDDPSATGTELVDEHFTHLVDGDEQGLDGLLSDAFTVQRADGSTATKDEYLAELPELKDFEIGDLSARQDGPALVVGYDQTVEAEQIGGTRFQGGSAPRLSTFVWQDGDWYLTSHANFNVPTGP